MLVFILNFEPTINKALIIMIITDPLRIAELSYLDHVSIIPISFSQSCLFISGRPSASTYNEKLGIIFIAVRFHNTTISKVV